VSFSIGDLIEKGAINAMSFGVLTVRGEFLAVTASANDSSPGSESHLISFLLNRDLAVHMGQTLCKCYCKMADEPANSRHYCGRGPHHTSADEHK
jgi:hypothetical protein